MRSAPLTCPSWIARLTAFGLSAALFLSGCTTLTSVPPPSPGASQLGIPVHVGDSIEARLKDGSVAVFEVTSIEPEAFVGAKQRVAFAQISELRVRHISPGKTAGLVGIVLVGTVVVLALVAAATGQLGYVPSGP